MAVLIGTSLVYKEIDKKTIFTLLSKPLHRAEFILGKFFGLVLTLLVMTAGMSLIFLVDRLPPHLPHRVDDARRHRLHLPRARPRHRRGHPLLLVLDAHPELDLLPGLLPHRPPLLGPRAPHQEDAGGRRADRGPVPLHVPSRPRELQFQDGGRPQPAHSRPASTSLPSSTASATRPSSSPWRSSSSGGGISSDPAGDADDRHAQRTRGGQGPATLLLVLFLLGTCASFMALKAKTDTIVRKKVPGSSIIYIPSGKVPQVRDLRLLRARRRPHLPLGDPVLQHADDRRPLRPPGPRLRHHRRARPALPGPLRDRRPDRHGRGPRHQARLQDPGQRRRPRTPTSGSSPSMRAISP